MVLTFRTVYSARLHEKTQEKGMYTLVVFSFIHSYNIISISQKDESTEVHAGNRQLY